MMLLIVLVALSAAALAATLVAVARDGYRRIPCAEGPTLEA
ncbi:hypothetical protein [Pseudolysinimonas sp.]|jgi:hypothetical protein